MPPLDEDFFVEGVSSHLVYGEPFAHPNFSFTNYTTLPSCGQTLPD